MTADRKLLLIGMMGAGKTTTGRLLAERLGWPYLDTDLEVERQAGRTVPEIWREQGEPVFRMEESRVLAEACARPDLCVVSVGGGAVMSLENREVIRRSGLVVWLRADASTLAKRVGGGAGRPLLEGGPAIALARLSESRAPLYSQVADLVFDVDRISPPQVVDRIVENLQHEGAQR